MVDNGLALLAAHLQQAGYDPTIFDFSTVDSLETIAREGKPALLEKVTDELHDTIQREDAKVIGFKLYSNGFDDIAKVAEELKRRNPSVLFAAGGPHVGIYGTNILRRTKAFDILVQGEGDLAIKRIAEIAYGKGTIADVPNAIHQNGRITMTRPLTADDISMDSMPFPVYDPSVYKKIGQKVMIPVIETERGCPYGQCTFCPHPNVNPFRRKRPMEQAIAEIEHNRDTYGTTFGRLAESATSPKALADLLQSCDFLQTAMFARSDSSYDFGALEGNVIAMFFGLESVNRHILEDLYRKTPNAQTYLRVAAENIAGAKAAGISTITSMIVPAPMETDDTMDESYRWLVQNNPDFVPALALGPIFGTEMYKAAHNGRGDVIILEKDFDYKTMMLELDLLRPPAEWDVPWQLVVNGEAQNPFAVTQQYVGRLMQHGMMPFSDELVLMAAAYNSGLSQDQDQRRKECLDFSTQFKQLYAHNDIQGMRDMVERINLNVGE